MIGRELSHFRIEAKLGEGGMGEVYRAEDSRLGRAVAIKVLPEGFASDPERLARFEREARVLASLSHPNIAAIHEVGEEDGVRFLVMELVPGETLAQRIERGPAPVGEAVAVAVQIAAALEAAHERGVIHRDLKPPNIKVDPSGAVKVLDFGLAKTIGPVEGGGAEATAGTSPTLTAPRTEVGALLGTAAYMSPEQVRGEPVDGRSDLWALGVVLFELLVGRPLFRGESVAEIVAAVLHGEIDLDALPDSTPPSVRRLLRRLLQRRTRFRLRHPGDAWLELREARQTRLGREPSVALEEARTAPAKLGSFALTMEICRHIDRESLVPEMIGDEMRFLDNGRASDVLAVYVPSIGKDHEHYREVIERSPYRGLAVSPYGWQEDAQRRPPIPLRDHLTLLGSFLEEAVSRIRPRRTVVVGFSSGADMALRLPSEAGVEVPSLDGILALGPNLSLDTCFFTAPLASIRPDSSHDMLHAFNEIGARAETIDAWLRLNAYVLELARRFHSDVATVQRVAQELVAPFRQPGPSAFAGWYRAARIRGIHVLALFCNEAFDRESLAALRMDHLDSGILGPDFHDGDLLTERDRSHLQLLEPELVADRIGELVTATPGSGRH